MEEKAENKRPINPRENASLLSIIFFAFTFKIFRKGFKKELQEDDIFEVLKGYRASRLGDVLQSQWKKEKMEYENPYILRSIYKLHWKEYAVYGVVSLAVRTILITVHPLSLGRIISYFSNKEPRLTEKEAYYYAAALMGCSAVHVLFFCSYYVLLNQLSLRIRTACCSLIFRKSIELSAASLTATTSGKIVTLITKDILCFDSIVMCINDFWVALVQVLLLSYVLYQQIGYAALLGVGFLLTAIPLQIWMGKVAAGFRLKSANKTDQRVRVTQEILSAIKIIKMFTWEELFTKLVAVMRKKEMRHLKILFCMKYMVELIGVLANKTSFLICLSLYVGLGNEITAAQLFVVIFCFNIIQGIMVSQICAPVTRLTEAKISVNRINDFLMQEEVKSNASQAGKIGVLIKNGTITLNKRNLLENINLELKSGHILLTGAIGSGKSSLLSVILKDLSLSEGILKVSGKISYCSQEPWLFPGTVKENILLGSYFDKTRYQNVLQVCALQKDLAQFPKGDETFVTDRGLNLSQGQKARINLARAMYRDSDIYLIDDCLSGLDNRVSQYIFQTCIKGFLKDKLCVLVTHHAQFLKKADEIILIKHGTVEIVKNIPDPNFVTDILRGAAPELLQNNATNEYGDEDANERSKLLNSPNNNNISKIYQETKKEGKVEINAYIKYFRAGGIEILIVGVVLLLGAQAMTTGSDYYLTVWVDSERNISTYQLGNGTDSTDYKTMVTENRHMLKILSLIIVASLVVTFAKSVIFFVFSATASINLHNAMFSRIIHGGMLFFDQNLSGNILNRFSKDLGLIDENLSYLMSYCFKVSIFMLSSLSLLLFLTPKLLFPTCIFMAVMVFLRYYYIKTSRNLKRLETSTRSPLVGTLNSSLEGLPTIRANDAQVVLHNKFDKYQDVHSSAHYMYITTARAFGFYLDMLGALYLSLVIISFLIFKPDLQAGKVGLALTQALTVISVIQWMLRQWSECENQMTSVERVSEYIKTDVEDDAGEKPQNWPNTGKIEFRNVGLNYLNRPNTLKNLNIIVESKQKVGIVGRTGAGKTSLVSVLFRLYEVEGSILIDDIDIKDVQVKYLRSNISMLPQDPVLFTGTVRSNLDPRNEHTDAELWAALDEVELKAFISNLNSGLNDEISVGAFSVGQKQLICLARVILNNKKVLVLDEATANIDPEIDELIQRTIRRKFVDCTVLTIAHRLHTIMDSDKVIVMDDGIVTEYEDPKVLLANKDSKFYKMVKDSKEFGV